MTGSLGECDEAASVQDRQTDSSLAAVSWAVQSPYDVLLGDVCLIHLSVMELRVH